MADGPPTSPEFPQSKTETPPTPLEKFIFTKKDYQNLFMSSKIIYQISK